MVPSVKQIKEQALKTLQESKALRSSEFRGYLIRYFELSEEDITVEYDSANGNKLNRRIIWALRDLSTAGIVEKLERGVYTLSNQEQTMNNSTETSSCSESPDQYLFDSFEKLKDKIYLEILDIINKKTPKEFENLAVKLFEVMGYGDGKVTRYSRDNGIDAIIKEDLLGFGHIYIQTKRFNNPVGRPEIQAFIGAIHGQGHGIKSKRAFITTSRFTKEAIEYAKANGVVLIDGKQLAKYIYDFGLGMQLESTLHIKKIDTDFWDMMEDE